MAKEYVPYVKTVNITENRAPTDDSVKILNEMSQKAKENIVGKISVQDNRIHFNLVVFRESLKSGGFEWFARLSVNGEEVKVDGTITRKEYEESFQNATSIDPWLIRATNPKNRIYTAIKHAFLKELMKQFWNDASIIAEPIENLMT